MPQLSPSTVSILDPRQSTGGVSVANAINSFRYNAQGSADAAQWSALADALSSAQSQINQITTALRAPLPVPQVIQITDQTGQLVAQIGNTIGSDNLSYPGIWGKYLYVGGSGPDTAPFFANGQQVAIGQNGQVFILDPFKNVGAWLGTQTEVAKTVTGVANNGAGLIRITIAAHGWITGDQVNIQAVIGVTAANGQWVISVFDADHFDLIGSTFAGSYGGGGTVQRFFAGGLFSTVAVGGGQLITSVANNGTGGVRVTVPAHGYATGYSVILSGVVGVPVTGISWNVTVIDSDNFDLVGSVFSGSYVSGGISLNWPTAKLIARDDGSLSITNATINLSGTLSTINLNPATGSITVTATNPGIGPPYDRTTISAGSVVLDQTGTGANSNVITLNSSGVYIVTPSSTGTEFLPDGTVLSVVNVDLGNPGFLSWTSTTGGYCDTSARGPFVLLQRSRGTTTTPTPTQSGDLLGGFGACSIISPPALTNNAPTGAIKFQAGSAQSFSNRSTRILFSVTSGTVTTDAMMLDYTGNLGLGITPNTFNKLDVAGNINTTGVYKVGGVVGIPLTASFVTALAVTTGSAVFGTPGAGQSNGTVVTGVSFTVRPTVFTGGILTQ